MAKVLLVWKLSWLWLVPHEGLPLVPHQPQCDLTGLPEEPLSAHGPHGMHHVLCEPEWHHLWHVKGLTLQGKIEVSHAPVRQTSCYVSLCFAPVWL